MRQKLLQDIKGEVERMKRSRMTVWNTQGRRAAAGGGIALVWEGEEGYPGTHKLSDMTQMHCATERRGGREREPIDSAVQHYSVVKTTMGTCCSSTCWVLAAKWNKFRKRFDSVWCRWMIKNTFVKWKMFKFPSLYGVFLFRVRIWMRFWLKGLVCVFEATVFLSSIKHKFGRNSHEGIKLTSGQRVARSRAEFSSNL